MAIIEVEEESEYVDGHLKEKYSVCFDWLKTPKSAEILKGKVVKDIKYYGCSILIIFEDDVKLEVDAEECFDFHVNIITHGKE
jgi:hypothetical protein